MTCKCGHEAVDHRFSYETSYWQNLPQFPCVKCDCENLENEKVIV